MPKLQRLKAEYDNEDARYATCEGERLPVLLIEYLNGDSYEEDLTDILEYEKDWARQFYSDLRASKKAIVSKQLSSENWPFVAIYNVSDVCCGNFLTCRFGAKSALLQPD